MKWGKGAIQSALKLKGAPRSTAHSAANDGLRRPIVDLLTENVILNVFSVNLLLMKRLTDANDC